MGQGKLSWIVAFWFAYTAFALPSRDGDEQEYFPLSGGIANGVMVTIEAEIDTSKKASIEFLTPSREVAFGWYMDVNAKTVKHGHRNNSWDSIYPSAAIPVELTQGSSLKLGFMKRKFQWGVAVNGQVQSWYSFSIPQEELVTHVSVHSGFANPEVVQQRQECNVQCHEDECRGPGGASVCPVGVQCTTTKRSANKWEAEACSASSLAGDVDENCCDGKPMTIPQDSYYEKKWVQLIASAEMTDFCQEYQCDAKFVPVAGKSNTKGFVLSTDGSSSYTVAVPAAQDTTQSEPIQPFPDFVGSHMTIPKFALRRSIGGNLKLKSNVSTALSGTNYKLDKSSVLVETTLDHHLDVQGWFLEYVTVPFEGEGENGTTVTRLLRGNNGAVRLRDDKQSPNGDFWYSDQDPADTTCTDAAYTGEYKMGANLVATCGNWTNQGWCHPWGQKTDQLCNGTGLDAGYCASPNFRPVGLAQCCICGGGSWTPPENPAVASHLLFQ